MMIKKTEFTAMRKELDNNDRDREKAILLSREIIKLSKQAIYAVQRDAFKESESFISKMEDKIKLLKKGKYDQGICKTAYQEYVEAVSFLYFLEKGKLISKKQCGVDSESYLLGLCDLTGELMRKAVNEVINENEGAVYIIRELVSDIYSEFLRFEFRNSELRKKSDSIKWNLQKIEDIIYNLELRC